MQYQWRTQVLTKELAQPGVWGFSPPAAGGQRGVGAKKSANEFLRFSHKKYSF